MLGCGLPGGEQGFNMARVVAILLGHATTCRAARSPGTARRRCRRPAWPARDQGRRGRRVHLRRRRDREPVRQGQLRRARRTRRTRCSPTPRRAARPRPRAAGHLARPARGRRLPDVYIAMGADRGERRRGRRASPARRWTSSASRSQNRAEEAHRRTASSSARSRRSPLPDGTVVSADDGPRAGVDAWRSSRRSSRCSAPTARSPRATPAR